MTAESMSASRGRLLIVLAAAAFFLAPMFAGRLIVNARINAWQDRGFARHEPPRWWNHGITTRAEALLWRSHGFVPETAGPWKRMEFIPVEAQEWSAAGFDVTTAVDWRREAFDPTAAAAWRQAQFSVGEAVAWRKRAFGPTEAAGLRRAGLSPLVAAETREARRTR